jgi:hypothetical protein
MGGNALKTHFGIEAKRVSTHEFHQIVSEAIVILNNAGYHNNDFVRFYANKESHGDIDMIVGTNEEAPNVSKIKELFDTDAVFKNSNCFSILFHGTQLDLIFVSNIKTRANLDFRNYSPFGNIFSRLLKQLDVSWKVDGLYYVLRLGDSYKQNIFLTDNFSSILEYGDLDPLLYGRFREEQDIFHYVTTSMYFRRSIYALENLNHINRKRDTVRPDYNRWNAYIQNAEDNLLPDQLPTEEENLHTIARHFPHVLSEIKKGYDGYLQTLKIREKFNGDLLSRETGLEGKELGLAISVFKDELGDMFDWYVLHTPKRDIIERFKDRVSLLREGGY